MERRRLSSEAGQIFVIFALALPVLLGAAAIVVDVGNLYFQKRTLQGAVDAAALAAAQDLASRTCNSEALPCYAALKTTVSNTSGKYSAKNAGTAAAGGLAPCAGTSADTNCYTWPMINADGTKDWNRVEVKLKKPVPTAFAKIFGVKNVDVAARAVASLRPGEPPPYSFVSLNSSCEKHTLILQVGGRLKVTSGIYVNSCNDHDGFDIKGDADTSKGELTAPVIKTVGGWEVYHDDSIVQVGGADCPIPPRKYFVGVNQSGGPCPEMGAPVLVDPFDGKIPLPTRGDASLGTGPTVANCGGVVGTSGTPRACVPPNGATLQPGTYYGGICIGTTAACAPNGSGVKPCNAGTASVNLAAGTYIMAGGGFWACGTSILNAPQVMIYNTDATAGSTTANGRLGQIIVNTKGSVLLGPQTAGTYDGMTVFQNPDLAVQTANNCGGRTADEADIAFLSLGPDVTSQVYGPYVDSGANLDAIMTVGATQLTADQANKIVTGDHISIEGEEFVAGAITGGGKVVAVQPAAAVAHAKGKKILVSRLTDVTSPGEHFGSVSGTIYAHHQTALFATENIKGTANLAVITGCIRIQGGDNTFDFQAEGLFGLAPSLSE